MKKALTLLLAMVMVISISVGETKRNVAYAGGELDNNSSLTAGSKENTEKFKAEFAYEMAQITARIVSTPATNVENFRVELVYANAQVTAKVIPIIPDGQRAEFAYEMAKITTKIISDQNLDIERAKAEFAYEIAQLTAKILATADKSTTGKNPGVTEQNNYIVPGKTGPTFTPSTGSSVQAGKLANNPAADPNPPGSLLRNNAAVEQKKADKVNNTNSSPPGGTANSVYVSPETYHGLVDDLSHVGDRSDQKDNKVNIDGEVRYHYAFNNGSGNRDKDSSGIRARLGFNTSISEDWQVHGMLEAEKSIVNYNNEFTLARLYILGRSGQTIVRQGYFDYLMAEGNIYDSGFKGIKLDFEEPVKYSLSYGQTDYSTKTLVATARYDDFDYNLEAGVYHYRPDGDPNYNRILTLGGNYNFSNFGLGAMYLGASRKDSQGNGSGYVFSFNYGDLKTWRTGTYDVFAKYYNQPRYTYFEHGMNGQADQMQGFKGYGLGVHYTLAPNFVGGLEFYNLADKISGERGNTWWSEFTYYF